MWPSTGSTSRTRRTGSHHTLRITNLAVQSDLALLLLGVPGPGPGALHHGALLPGPLPGLLGVEAAAVPVVAGLQVLRLADAPAQPARVPEQHAVPSISLYLIIIV